jgi:hypothetical protein
MQFLRDRGIPVRVVERWIPIVKIRKDLWGADLQAAIGTDMTAIQAGISAHHKSKCDKAVSDADVKLWLNTRNKFLVWTWGKRAAFRKNGTRKLRDEYKAKITEIRLSGDSVIAVPFELFL